LLTEKRETGSFGLVSYLFCKPFSASDRYLALYFHALLDLALVAINKAGGANKTRAQQARIETQNALQFFPPAPTGWVPRAVTCPAMTGAGISGLWQIMH